MLYGVEADGGKGIIVKDKIYHQIVRYTYAQQAVNALRKSKKHTILEVGAGAHANLAQYLPEDDITFLDLVLPEEVLADPRFVVGDATNLSYEAESFDFVVALDVIEHIPVEKRMQFIENINRVAKIGVILSAPHYSSKNPYEDELLKKIYLVCGSEPPIWIDEHIDCTLPAKADIVDMVKAQGVSEDRIFAFCGVKRELMQKMLIMEAAASKFDRCLEFFDIVNTEYIHSILYQDLGMQEDEAMKTYVVWTKDRMGAELAECFKANEETQDAILKFEKKYSELMDWVLGLANISYALSAREENQKNAMQIREQYEEVGRQIQQQGEAVMARVQQQGEENASRQIQNTKEIVGEIRALKGEKIKLNVILITYNHSKFIRETLETVLMQRTKFRFNVIVADDCSKDDTVSIIKEMEAETDIPFVYLPNDHNLGIMQNYKRAFAACDGEYVAIMEGDDLWTDEYRLQKHVDFLDNHCECAMSFNRYVVKNFEEGTFHTQPRFSAAEETQYFKYITGHDLAYNNLIGNFSTSVYRSSALRALPEQMYSIKCYDWLTNIMISKMGYIGCLIQPMSIYRVHSGGTWSGQSEREKLQSIIEAIDVYDEYTNREFTAGFGAHKARLCAMLSTPETQVAKKNKLKECIKGVLRKCNRLSAYVPPIFISIIKLLVPAAIKDKIVRNL